MPWTGQGPSGLQRALRVVPSRSGLSDSEEPGIRPFRPDPIDLHPEHRRPGPMQEPNGRAEYPLRQRPPRKNRPEAQRGPKASAALLLAATPSAAAGNPDQPGSRAEAGGQQAPKARPRSRTTGKSPKPGGEPGAPSCPRRIPPERGSARPCHPLTSLESCPTQAPRTEIRATRSNVEARQNCQRIAKVLFSLGILKSS